MPRKLSTLRFILLPVGLTLFFLIGRIEAGLVVHLWRSPWPAFRDFMADSLYEGDFIGASDFGVTAAILCFIIWVYRRRGGSWLGRLSINELKFIWLSSFMTAILAVHSLKWIIGRARPNVFFESLGYGLLTQDQLNGMSLPGFLPLFGPRGIGLNSFPSGHTASCAILLTFSYVLWPKKKAVSLFFGLCVLTLSIAMGAARSMSGMHWLSDSVASVFLTWSIIDHNWHRMCNNQSRY